ncbi:PAS domain S-box protein [Halobellus sp. Atlit-31R]|nr:PAS domain S-box protein [Halobellus sp. Atlit-31R]
MPSAQFLDSVLEALSAGVAVVDATGRITHVDDAFCDAVGTDRTALLDADLFDELVAAEHRSAARSELRTRLDRGSDDSDDADGPRVAVGSDGASHDLVWQSTIAADGERFAVGRLDDRTETLWPDSVADPYRALVENAPVPIIVSDRTGQIRAVNAEAEALIGRSRTELTGERVTTLHPAADAARYEELFGAHVRTGGTRRSLPDGEQIHVVDADGDATPVEISVATVESGGEASTDETLIHGIFRDISDQVWYERTLEELHENARDLVRAETEAEVAESIVETAVETIRRDVVVVYRFDADAEQLRPIAYSEQTPAVFGELSPLSLADSVVGEAYLRNDSLRLDDVRTHERVHDPETSVRSELVVPIDGFGVIVCGHPSAGEFDATDQRLVELLSKNAEAVLDRTEREQELRRQRQELERRTKTLQQAEQLNADIREIVRIAITADTRAELEQEACELFGGADPFTFAWIGAPGPERDELVSRTWAGDGQGYLDVADLSLDDGVRAPAARTAQTGETTVVENTAVDVQEYPWRRDAVRRGFRSVVAVPLQYRGVLYGVLTVFADRQDAISGRIAAVLEECGELLASVMSTMEWEDAVLSRGGTELEFAIGSPACPLLRLAQEHQCSFSFRGLHQKDDGDTTVFVRSLAGAADCLTETAAESTGISSTRQLGDDALFQVTLSEPFLAATLAQYGIRLRRIVGEGETDARARVTIPATMPVHRAVEIVSTAYPQTDLRSVDEPGAPPVTAQRSTESALHALTDRQRETLELAYYGGYFESPKTLSGADLASKMDISSSAFHNRLHAAQRNLLGMIFGEQPPTTDLE